MPDIDLKQATEQELTRLRWGVVANAGRLSKVKRPRWAHVMDATGFGSTSATALCVAAGFDPNEEVGNYEDEELLSRSLTMVCMRL